MRSPGTLVYKADASDLKSEKLLTDLNQVDEDSMTSKNCLVIVDSREGRTNRLLLKKLLVLQILLLLFLFSTLATLWIQYRDNEYENRQLRVDELKAMEQKFENYLKFVEIWQSMFGNDTPELSSENVTNASNYSTEMQCGNIPQNLRFDCHPEDGASQLACTKRACCWNPVTIPNCKNGSCDKRVPLDVPYCYYPENWPGYQFVNSSDDGDKLSVFLKRSVKSAYDSDIPLIKIEASSINKDIMRVKIYDPTTTRYEPPWPIRDSKKTLRPKIDQSKCLFEIDNARPGFRVKRTADNSSLFDSIGKGGFIFADQFLQLHAILPTHNIYGLGEHRTSLKLNTNWQSFTMFNKDQPPTEHANLYGDHPFYLTIEESGDCHGVLLLNSNAMDVILQPAPAITFRTIGGIFDMYFFIGPTPADVIRQYSEIVGKPFLPPYWSLGFHLCKFGYQNIGNTRAVWNRTRNAGIPFDTQWNDIDYMDKANDFTYDKNNFGALPEFIDELHAVGMHYIPIIDAGVSASEKNGTYPPYDEGIRDDIFIKDSATNAPFIGKVWNKGLTVWPDFTHPKCPDYFLRMLRTLHEKIKFDGIWLDMNEPSNFYNGHPEGCSQNKLDYPQYVPNIVDGLLATKTLCMDAKHHLGSHYNLHNVHGISEVTAVNPALISIRNKRPFIISRSSWVGLGHYGGHWTGDIYSSWHDLKMSIPEVLMYSLFQVPMVGADICGFDGNTTEALCNRWMQLGAFYPFSRNHNSDDTIEQDPVIMGDLVVKSSRKALMIRYRFLPYLYTLFVKAHLYGDTVARPLLFEFIDDPNTYDLDTQFLWGSAFMIIPVLEENKTEVTAYLPRGVWYDFYSKHFTISSGSNVTLQAPLDTIPIMIRGGSILPAQTPGVTTTESRGNAFELLVALDDSGFAVGELFWDDGDSLDSIEKREYTSLSFTVANQTLTSIKVENTQFEGDMILGKVSVMGVTKQVKQVIVNNNAIGFSYDKNRSYLNVKGLLLDMKKPLTLSWVYSN